MSGFPAPVGVTLRTSFVHRTASLLQAAFTIAVYKNGVAGSTAGITLTYVSGFDYTITIDGMTGFVNAPGQYDLVISVTADSSYIWSETWYVTSDSYQVLGAYSAPIAIYTATSGAGRITDGSNPIQGAVVTVLRPNGSTLTQKVTNIAGLYGSVVFDTTGAHSLVVQANGYSQPTATVTVTGSTATGPAIDIAMTAVTTVGTLSASTLWAYARRMYKDHLGAKADAEIKDAVNEALWMIADAKDWSHYQTVGEIRTRAPVNGLTATLTLDSAVVTITAGGIIPTWVDDTCDVQLSDGQWYPILTRDADDQLTVTSVWPINTTSAGITIVKSRYILPSDCRNIEKVMTSQTWIWGNIPVSPAAIEMAKRRIQTFTPMWAIERGHICMWPAPNVDTTNIFLYWRKPVALTTSTDLADIDARYITVLHRAIDYQISLRGDCVAGTKAECRAVFQDEMGRAVPNDIGSSSKEAAPPTAGFNPWTFMAGRVTP